MRSPRFKPQALRASSGALTLCLAALPWEVFAADKISFNRDVRPIFSDTCFACHGPDEASRKGELRVDTLALAQKGGKSGKPAIVPGKPLESQAYQRLISPKDTELMPPPDSHKVLSKAQIETIRQWIAEGAEYQGHWAFQKPVPPAVPPVPAGGNKIDAFILKTLAEKGLKASPQADKTTLIRRASLDLTGLPPTAAEIAAFEKDTSPDAWSRLLDRLLASPHYGERMAMTWLDYARYADSHGFQTDSSRTMWPWRDWVINAFNTNKPFDQFTVEQLAGDLLPNPTLDQVIATGFNRNHRINGEGGLIAEEWRMENIIDRVETTGSTWMALTFNCCRCHDHKYDPITQKEFYQLTAYFNSVAETGIITQGGGANRAGGNPDPVVNVPKASGEQANSSLDEAVAAAEAALSKAEQAGEAEQAAWEKAMRESLAGKSLEWKPIDFTEAKSAGGATLTEQSDRSWLATGANPAEDTYTLKTNLPEGSLHGLLLEVLPDPKLGTGKLGRAPNGNFVLADFEAEITAPTLDKPISLSFLRAESDYDQADYPFASLADVPDAPKSKGKGGKGWAIMGFETTGKKSLRGLLICAEVAVPDNATLTVRLKHEGFPNHNIGHFRIGEVVSPAATSSLKAPTFPAEAVQALAIAPASRSKAQTEVLAKLFRASPAHPSQKAKAVLAAARKNRDAAKDMSVNTMVMKELETPRDAFLLKRGQYDQPGEKVERKLPAFLPPMPAGEPNNRLGLARWLVSGNHPLTARVWVNRTWEKFFGHGLVKTSENFGSQSEWPTHPELLDWLSVEFVACGWDMKAMQKLIMMSAAYRQSAQVTPEQLEKDPDNRWIGRGPRFRLQAELIRDQALAISGLLAPRIGGPSVRPYMPNAVWDETSVYGNMRGYKADTGEGLYRRTLYTIWKRTAAPPTMLLFDSPSREICTVKRSTTNTPLQALSLLNEVTYVEAARKLAERILREGGKTSEERLGWAFRQVTCRAAKPAELSVLAGGLEKRLVRFRADPESAKKILAAGASPVDASFDPAELAAWAVTCNVLLNLDEAVMRE